MKRDILEQRRLEKKETLESIKQYRKVSPVSSRGGWKHVRYDDMFHSVSLVPKRVYRNVKRSIAINQKKALLTCYLFIIITGKAAQLILPGKKRNHYNLCNSLLLM